MTLGSKTFHQTNCVIHTQSSPAYIYLDEQRLAGCLHGLLGCLELGLELGRLGPGFIELGHELLQLSMEEAVLGPGLLVQSPALLQLRFSVEELGLRLLLLRLHADQLVAGALQLSPGLLQLASGGLELGPGLLQLVLALVQFGRQLVLSGAHGGGDFEQLASGLLQGLQLAAKQDKAD